jgi:uncharacterized membrane protein
MALTFKIFLVLHIIGGSIGLTTGVINLLRKKGDQKHKLTGKIFYISMLAAGFSSLILAYLHPNYFLFMVGIFTLYMIGSGQRYLKHKQPDKMHAMHVEWIITIIMLLSATVFIGIGILKALKSDLFGIVFLTFGSLGLLFVLQDFVNFRGKSRLKNYWLIGHLQRMTGGFIAASTAFLVVNAKYLPHQIPDFIYWLLPTIIFTPLIIQWSRRYGV